MASLVLLMMTVMVPGTAGAVATEKQSETEGVCLIQKGIHPQLHLRRRTVEEEEGDADDDDDGLLKHQHHQVPSFLRTAAGQTRKYSHAQFEECAKEMDCEAEVAACHDTVFCHDNMVEEKLRALEADPSLANAGVLIEGAQTPEGQALAKCISPRKLMTTACLYEKKIFECLEEAGCRAEVQACEGNGDCNGNERHRGAKYLRQPTPENAADLAVQPRATPEGQSLLECRQDHEAEVTRCMELDGDGHGDGDGDGHGDGHGDIHGFGGGDGAQQIATTHSSSGGMDMNSHFFSWDAVKAHVLFSGDLGGVEACRDKCTGDSECVAFEVCTPLKVGCNGCYTLSGYDANLYELGPKSALRGLRHAEVLHPMNSQFFSWDAVKAHVLFSGDLGGVEACRDKCTGDSECVAFEVCTPVKPGCNGCYTLSGYDANLYELGPKSALRGLRHAENIAPEV